MNFTTQSANGPTVKAPRIDPIKADVETSPTAEIEKLYGGAVNS